MAPELYIFSICLPFVTILLVFGMRYFAQIQQAKARGASDEALAAIEARLAAIEKILKDVG